VLVPAQCAPLLATDFYQILDTSDVPAGAVNIITGNRDELAKTLSEHDEVAALWYHGSVTGSAMVEKASAGNLKSTWVNDGKQTDWSSAEGTDFLRRATQVKNIWIPYGE
jgi:aldehyde dehydrogenase (NAD+)